MYRRFPSASILAVGLCFILAACNTTARMDVQPTADRTTAQPLAFGLSKATFVLAGIVSGIGRGDPIFAFPAETRTKGMLCNYKMSGDNTVTYSGGRRFLGDWSDDFGEMFHEEFSRHGIKVAGDPSQLFHRKRDAASADFQIAGRLVSMKGNFCHAHHWWDGKPLHEYSGEMSVEIEWSVLSNLTDEVVLQDRTWGYFKQNETIKQGITLTFEQAIASAISNFAANRKLRALAVGMSIKPEVRQARQSSPTATGLLVQNGASPGAFNGEQLVRSVVTIRVGGGHGSGFFIGRNGHVLTNAHVVGNARRAQIITSQGIEVEAEVVSRDVVRDVAVLKSPLRIPEPLSFNLKQPGVAETVYAVGTPIDQSLSTTVTRGIVSALRWDSDHSQSFIQADVAVSPGSSGGPLINSRGEVVGITVSKVAQAEGLNMFIPIGEGLHKLGIRLQ